jgi:hypothetical protein
VIADKRVKRRAKSGNRNFPFRISDLKNDSKISQFRILRRGY